MTVAVASDLIPIKSTTRTIQDCFKSCLYVVPGFQRPYSWDTDQLADYWSDVVEAKGDFFFGSTVTWESTSRELFNNSYSIIDGQQRLTTSAIVLSVIRDAFRLIAESGVPDDLPEVVALRDQARSQAANTQRYIVATDDDGRKYPVITRDEPNFREVIQNPSAIPSNAEWNGSAIQIGKARSYFEQRVQTSVGDKTVAEMLEELKVLRGNVLKARIIQVELASEEDGFLIFETLNARGADLRLADLVKNLLIRGGAHESDDRRAIAQRWETLSRRVEGHADTPNAFDQFIWQSWNSRREADTEVRLYKVISDTVRPSSAAHLAYLEELEFDSRAYQYIDDDDFVINRESVDRRSILRIPEVTDAMRALALFNVSVANSALLAIARKYEQTNLLSRAQAINAARAIESFHFQFTALKNSGSTGGTRGRYNRFAVELEQATSRTAVDRAISSFKSRLAGSLPASHEAQAAFSALFYAPRIRLNAAQKRRSRKDFIAYVLMRLSQAHRVLPAGQTLADWTVEHIKPQSEGNDEVTSAEYSIGNLTLLTPPANGHLGDLPFAGKRDGLRRYVPWQDDTLSTWIEDEDLQILTSDAIRARAKALAALAVESVWSIA